MAQATQFDTFTLERSFAGGERRFSASLLTFEFFSDGPDGTRLVLTHQAMYGEGADGPALRRAGWQQLLEQLHADLAAA